MDANDSPGNSRLWYVAIGSSAVCAASAWFTVWFPSYHLAVNRFHADIWYVFLALGIAGKAGFLCCFPSILRRLFGVVRREPARWLAIGVVWLAGSVAMVGLLALGWDRLMESTQPGIGLPYHLSDRSIRDVWLDTGGVAWIDWGGAPESLLRQWGEPRILGKEAAFLLAFGFLLLATDSLWPNKQGKPSRLKALFATLLVGGLILAWPWFAGLLTPGSTSFVDSIFTNALALELFVPIAVSNSATAIGSLFYLAFSLSTCTGVWCLRRRDTNQEERPVRADRVLRLS